MPTVDDDDVWGGSDSDDGELRQEWRARHSQFHTLGYRDGVEAGKNSAVQEGFNVGYAQAAAPGFNWGIARGLTRAFAALPAALKEKLIVDSDARARLENLDRVAHGFSATEAQRSFYRYLMSGSDSQEIGEEVGTQEGLGSRPVLESQKSETLPNGTEGLEQGSPDDLGLGSGVVSMAGVDRVPESGDVGVWEDGSSSAGSGKSELGELEKKVRSEFEVASVKISGALVGA